MNLAVFDIDGTLTLPYRMEDACFLKALDWVFGFHEVDADWTKYADVTDSGLVRELCVREWGREPKKDEVGRFREAYFREFLKRSHPDDGREVPGAAAFLHDFLARPDWRLALATGNFHSLALHKLKQGRIPHAEIPMATADDAPSRATLVTLAVSRAQMQYAIGAFDHVVSIGDAPWDLRTARELDMAFVAVGERCGGPTSATILDYRDVGRVLSQLEEAVCW
jgi:phosphoglycolate phosphatase-like HAD superfamily hydrolase